MAIQNDPKNQDKAYIGGHRGFFLKQDVDTNNLRVLCMKCGSSRGTMTYISGTRTCAGCAEDRGW